MNKFVRRTLSIACTVAIAVSFGVCSTVAVSASNGLSSTRTNPLKKGQWGICSKYNPDNKKYQNVLITVNSFTRGDAAAAAVKKFCSSGSSIYKYSKPKKGMEWVVAKYSIKFNQFKVGSLGASPSVTVALCSKATPNGISYNDISYFIQSVQISSDNYVKGAGGSASEAFQMPIGCKDYVIKFGDYKHTNAFFQGT